MPRAMYSYRSTLGKPSGGSQLGIAWATIGNIAIQTLSVLNPSGWFGPSEGFQERQKVRDYYYGIIGQVRRTVLPDLDPELADKIEKDLDYLVARCKQRCGYPDDVTTIESFVDKWDRWIVEWREAQQVTVVVTPPAAEPEIVVTDGGIKETEVPTAGPEFQVAGFSLPLLLLLGGLVGVMAFKGKK